MPAKPKLLFPSTHVIQARFNERLQRQHRAADAQARYRDTARGCPTCQCPSNHLSWIYFRSDAWTWTAGCGTGGWLTMCDACDAHIDYFVEEVSEQGVPEPIKLQPGTAPSVRADGFAVDGLVGIRHRED